MALVECRVERSTARRPATRIVPYTALTGLPGKAGKRDEANRELSLVTA